MSLHSIYTFHLWNKNMLFNSFNTCILTFYPLNLSRDHLSSFLLSHNSTTKFEHFTYLWTNYGILDCWDVSWLVEMSVSRRPKFYCMIVLYKNAMEKTKWPCLLYSFHPWKLTKNKVCLLVMILSVFFFLQSPRSAES